MDPARDGPPRPGHRSQLNSYRNQRARRGIRKPNLARRRERPSPQFRQFAVLVVDVDAGRGALSICSVRIAAAGIIEAVDSKVGHPRIAGVHHMGLSVGDCHRGIRFYCDVLGAALFREPYDGNSPSFSGRMAIVSLGALGLDLIEHASNGERNSPTWPYRARSSLVPDQSLNNCGARARWLDACDVSHSGVRDVAGVGSMLNFADPDGIAVEFLFLDLEKLSRGAFAPG